MEKEELTPFVFLTPKISSVQVETVSDNVKVH